MVLFTACMNIKHSSQYVFGDHPTMMALSDSLSPGGLRGDPSTDCKVALVTPETPQKMP